MFSEDGTLTLTPKLDFIHLIVDDSSGGNNNGILKPEISADYCSKMNWWFRRQTKKIGTVYDKSLF